MNIKFCCIGSGVVVAGIGITLIVLSSLVVNFVNNRIEDGVKDKLTVKENFGSWSQEDINDWKDYNVNYTYYVWNFTNANAALFFGQKPVLQAVGPFYAREENHRFNITWNELSSNPVGTVVSYNEWWQRVWTNDTNANVDVNNSAKKVTAVNLPYLGVLGAIRPETGSDNKESVFLRNTIASVVTNVRNTLTALNGTFISQLRAVSFRAFLSFALTGGKSPADWATGTTASTGNLTCFELASPASSGGALDTNFLITDAAIITALFNTSSSVSLVSAVGAQTWGGSLLSSAITTQLNAVYGDANVNKVKRWIALVIDPTSYCWPTYEPTAATAMGASLGCTGAASFGDLGACQFGSGAVSISNGLGNSVQAFDALCNTTNAFVGASAAGFTCAGPEFYAFAQANCGVNNHSLTVAEAKVFWNTFNALGTAPFNPANCSTTPFTGVRGLLTYYAMWGAAAAAGNSAQVAAITAMINSTFFTAGLSSDRVAGQCIVRYLSYAGRIYGLYGGTILSGNSGVFTTRTPQEIFLGYVAPDPVYTAATTTAQTPNGLPWFGALTSYSSETDLLTRTQQRRYRYYTGTDDIAKANMYQAWRGATIIQKRSDVFSACPCSEWDRCNGSCVARTCPDVWLTPDNLDLTSDAGNFAPFKEGANPNVVLKVFLSEALRVLNFTYRGDTEVKGIKTRRYALQTTHLDNQTVFPANSNYRMTGPNGVVWMNDWQNAPLYLSRPHFWQVNDEVKTPFGAGSFEPNGTLQDDGEDGFFTYVDVEPLSGATIRGHKRLQLSLKLATDMLDGGFYNKLLSNGIFDWDTATNSLSNTTKAIYWPLYWGDQNGVIKDKDASDFRTKIYDNRKLSDRLEIAGYVVGAFLTFVGVLAVVYGIMKGRAENSPTRMESTPNLSNM